MVTSTNTAYANPRTSERQTSREEVRFAGEMLDEAAFLWKLHLERRRTERSGNPFVLLLLGGVKWRRRERVRMKRSIHDVISSCLRETDIFGWHQQDETIGVLLTDMCGVEESAIESITLRVTTALGTVIGVEEAARLRVTVHHYPQPVEAEAEGECEEAIYRDLVNPSARRSMDRMLKRSVDIVGSLGAILILMPLFLIIAMLVKCSSRGSVFYSQKRVGQYGRLFTFYKFRSMHQGSDTSSHKAYVTKLIAGSQEACQTNGTYKMVDDPRITPIGRFLRKTSLDELPQFMNVLRGDMSLVGPRPPIPYECACYQQWHKRRVFEIQPGLTGLWQIKGRSRTTFNEMVRMDIGYARSRSLMHDINIIVKTPGVMFTGSGAS